MIEIPVRWLLSGDGDQESEASASNSETLGSRVTILGIPIIEQGSRLPARLWEAKWEVPDQLQIVLIDRQDDLTNCTEKISSQKKSANSEKKINATPNSYATKVLDTLD